MCGICGVVSADISPDERRQVVGRMCAALVHRGPDDVGIRDFGTACIGMRRLSIIDTSPKGHQPMPNEDRSAWLVLNGEIYNFQALRDELLGRGHVFRSHSDAEPILHLYEEKGASCCESLRGMFGFALWNDRENSLLLVRDRLGIKPLYYAEIKGGWAFASEVRAIISAGLVKTDLDFTAFDQYISFGCVPPPRTMVKGIRALLPGHRAKIEKGRLTIEKWWDFPEPGSNPLGDEEILAGIRETLEESIRLHRISDVPIGAFLSGGIDSTAVVGLMSRERKAPVRTFSIGFDDAPDGFDERKYARATSRAFWTEHTEVVVGGATIREEIPRVIRHMDQPSFDGVNSFLISRAAKAGGLTVALSGLGGDEVFGGYDSFRMIPRWGKMACLWGGVPGPIRGALVKAFQGRGRDGIGAASERARKVGRLRWVDSPLGLYALARLVLWPEEKAGLYSPDLQSLLDRPDREDAMDLLHGMVAPGDGMWRMVSLLEMQCYMGWRLLRDTDVMSMAHSLEVRVPFIDHKVVELVCGLRSGWENAWGHPKRLLTESLSDILPAEVVHRNKQGFSFPMEKWMKGELREVVEDALSYESIRRRGFFSAEGMKNLYAGFLRGKVGYPVIWQMVVLELWMREVLDGVHFSGLPIWNEMKNV